MVSLPQEKSVEPKNQRYFCLDDYELGDSEKIAYKMIVSDKTYEATFYQKMEYIDTVAIEKQLKKEILSEYTEEQMKSLTQEEKKNLITKAMSVGFDMIAKKVVWFTISRFNGEFYIVMYYDNKYNQANGEDL